jgi:hypothetical protein
MCVTGPAMKYRLEVIKGTLSEKIRKKWLLIFTDNYSYDLYKDLHNDFDFIILDDIRKDYPDTFKYECLLNKNNVKDYFEEFVKFYNLSGTLCEEGFRRLYPFEIHRFAFPYLIKNNILNFIIVCSDFSITNDEQVIEEYFKRIKSGTLHCLYFHGQYRGDLKHKEFIQKELQPIFNNIDLSNAQPFWADGFLRGFHFKNIEDMGLFFKTWNDCILKIIPNHLDLYGGNYIIYACWLVPTIMTIFEKMEYKLINSCDFIDMAFEGRPGTYKIGLHITKPEDTLYFGGRSPWQERYGFDYSGVCDIESFIKKNKKQLKDYYENHGAEIQEITDTHVFAKVKKYY